MKTSLLTPLFLLLAACAGTAARQNTLLPALSNAWAHIRLQVLREAPALANDVLAADQALAGADPVTIASVQWTVLETAAAADTEKRLAAQAIGPLVAESLRGRLVDFTQARKIYLRQP
jgi:hypothetical protein